MTVLFGNVGGGCVNVIVNGEGNAKTCGIDVWRAAVNPSAKGNFETTFVVVCKDNAAARAEARLITVLFGVVKFKVID
jgi:DNA-binding protein YbaB